MARSTVILLSLLHLQILLTCRLAAARGNRRDTTLATFNVGLVPGTLGRVDERVTVMIDQIIQSDVDIFCLQEVWEPSVQRKIYSEVKGFYPYALSAVDLENEPVSDGTTACDSDLLDVALACRERACQGLTGPALIFCGTLSCKEFSRLSDPCTICLSLEFIFTNETLCRTAPATQYEKTYGLMFLSTKELKNPTVMPQNNQSQIRGILTASVDAVGDLLCTHLTTPLAPVYAGPPVTSPFLYSSYSEQHNDEVLKIFDLIQDMKVPILMGDFNHGPGSPGGIVWHLPFHYGLLNARGFVSPYVLKDGRCTFCIENPLTNLTPDWIIDHIYITTDTFERVIASERFFDVVFPSIDVPISDHYGVMLRLSNIRKKCNPWQQCRNFCESEIQELLPLQLDYSDVCFQ